MLCLDSDCVDAVMLCSLMSNLLISSRTHALFFLVVSHNMHMKPANTVTIRQESIMHIMNDISMCVKDTPL